MGRRRQQDDTGNLNRSWRKAIIDTLSDPDYQPEKFNRLRRRLGVDHADYDTFSRVVNELEETGVIVNLKRKGLALAQAADLVSGTIDFHRAGSAIVTRADNGKEVYIPARETGMALPGDKVLVRVTPRRGEPGAGRAPHEGTVIRVVERQRKTIVGTLRRQRRVYYVKPMQATITTDILVPEPGGANEGDRVLVQLTAWDDPHHGPEGEIVEVIGPADDASLDTLSICRAYELPETFPLEAIAEAEAATIDDDAIQGRLDLRRKFIFTIDPATARDFDDAISLEPDGKGRWRLGVHIADVSHFVPVGSALDKEAVARGTSVYFPDRVVPMLPEQLSNGLCSLRPDVDRLAFSVFLTLDDDGKVHGSRFADSVIRSRLRLTYEQALEAIQTPEGQACPAVGLNKSVVGKLHQVHRLAQACRRARFAQGSLEMDLPEVRFLLGDDGRIQDVEQVAHDVSHQLIEECMLLANEYVCRELCRRSVPLLHRIHDEPDPEKLAELEAMFLGFGWHVGDLTERHNMVRLLQQVAERPESQALYTSVLRAMRRAMYSAECVGHYGLAKQYYAHFTSPIRRYPDLVVHRILRAVLHGQRSPYPKRRLEELGEICSGRENVATEAERELVELKKMRFFSDQLATGDLRQYDATVMEVRNFGIFVHLPAVQAYGLIHVSQLSEDFFDYNPVGQELKGRRTGQRFRIGNQLRVVVAKVDFDRYQLDFAPVPQKTPPAKRSGRRRR